MKLIWLLLPLLAACGSELPVSYSEKEPGERSKILEDFQKIEIGMTADQVKALIGEPGFTANSPDEILSAGYGVTGERALEDHESPYALSAIMVEFEGGKVASKEYNHQWVWKEQRQLFEEKKKSGEKY